MPPFSTSVSCGNSRFSRCTTGAVDIAGTRLPEGARVAVLFGSANRDETHYEHPDRFDVTRNPVDLLTFGRGVHHCVGSHLARMEGHAVLHALRTRVQRFELDDAVWRTNNALHGLERCVVRTR